MYNKAINYVKNKYKRLYNKFVINKLREKDISIKEVNYRLNLSKNIFQKKTNRGFNITKLVKLVES